MARDADASESQAPFIVRPAAATVAAAAAEMMSIGWAQETMWLINHYHTTLETLQYYLIFCEVGLPRKYRQFQ